MMLTVGIDLGTTNSVACYVDKDNIPKVLHIDGMEKILPSVVSYVHDKAIVGRQAILNSVTANTIFSIKRYMGKDYDFFGHSPENISAEILKHIKLSIEKSLNDNLQAAVITVPARFSELERTSTLKAASIAGIKVLRLINEPTAAAIAFGIDKKEDGVFAVYDFGGGTFDFSVLRLQNGIFQVLATGGSLTIGGDDIDEEIFNINVHRFNIKTASLDSATKIHCKYLCKQMKEQILLKKSISKEVIINNKQYIFTLTDIELQSILKDFIQKTINISNNVIEDAKLKNCKLDAIILVGGMTRIQYVKDSLANIFNTKILDNVDPDEAVAIGSGICAKSLTQTHSDVLLIDVVPLSLGIETYGGIVDKIIYRNTPIPIIKKREYTTYEDNQFAISFNIVQGERTLAKDCISIIKFELNNIPPMRAGQPRIDVIFSVDVNGLLSISAQENITGIRQNVVIEYVKELSSKDIIDSLQSSFNTKDADQIIEKNISIKIEVERLLKFWNLLIPYFDKNLADLVNRKMETIKQLLKSNSMDTNLILQTKRDIENIVSPHIDKIINLKLTGKSIDEI